MNDKSEFGFGLAPVKKEGCDENGNPVDEPTYKVHESDLVQLSSGREFYANHKIIGINEDNSIYEGYDGGINDDQFTFEEKAELADMMIARWNRYKGKS